jgi:transposase, IS5 family
VRPTKQDLLRSRLDQIVDLAHPLAKLAWGIDWPFLEQRLGAAYTDCPGRPPLPTRLMAGLAILKHRQHAAGCVPQSPDQSPQGFRRLSGARANQHRLVLRLQAASGVQSSA